MIGVFDSGYGGLNILREFLKTLPEYDYLYLGDNARAPYGNRSNETLIKYGEQAVEYLFNAGCKLIIVACNTASSNVLRHLQEKYLRTPGVSNLKILGVIKPQVEMAVKSTKSGRIGVVGTTSTIESKSFEKELKHLLPDCKVASYACPLLVPLVEEHWHTKPEAKMILKKYLRPLKTNNIDTLILGCTHYPFLYKDFCRIMGKNIKVLNPGEIVAASLKDYLQRHAEIEQLLSRNGQRDYLTTGNVEKFKIMGAKFLGIQMKSIQSIDLT